MISRYLKLSTFAAIFLSFAFMLKAAPESYELHIQSRELAPAQLAPAQHSKKIVAAEKDLKAFAKEFEALLKKYPNLEVDYVRIKAKTGGSEVAFSPSATSLKLSSGNVVNYFNR